MTIRQAVTNASIDALIRILCRVDGAQLASVPRQGPLIVVCNHVNFLDAPVFYTRMLPRRVIAMAKTETWDNPALAFLAETWEAIPLARGEADVAAFKRALAVLKAGGFLVVAPEGTRSRNGCLQEGHAGVVLLALHSGAPVLPIAFHGAEPFWQNVKRFRRTDFRISVGRPFKLTVGESKITRELRHQMLAEIMYQLAAALPPRYRGRYADLDTATTRFLQFLDRFDPPPYAPA